MKRPDKLLKPESRAILPGSVFQGRGSQSPSAAAGLASGAGVSKVVVLVAGSEVRGLPAAKAWMNADGPGNLTTLPPRAG